MSVVKLPLQITDVYVKLFLDLVRKGRRHASLILASRNLLFHLETDLNVAVSQVLFTKHRAGE